MDGVLFVPKDRFEKFIASPPIVQHLALSAIEVTTEYGTIHSSLN